MNSWIAAANRLRARSRNLSRGTCDGSSGLRNTSPVPRRERPYPAAGHGTSTDDGSPRLSGAAIIYMGDRAKYLKALRRADAGDCGALGQFIATAVPDTLYKFIVPAIARPARLVRWQLYDRRTQRQQCCALEPTGAHCKQPRALTGSGDRADGGSMTTPRAVITSAVRAAPAAAARTLSTSMLWKALRRHPSHRQPQSSTDPAAVRRRAIGTQHRSDGLPRGSRVSPAS